MARVKVEWTEEIRYSAEFEVDGWDDSTSTWDPIYELIGDLTAEQKGTAAIGGDGVEIVDALTTREGEVTPEIKTTAKHGEKDWDF